MDVEYFKDEALRMLTRPMDEISHLFQAAFGRKGFHNERISSDWAKGTIAIEFVRRNPSADEIRETIFSLYEKEWGGKPGGLEVAYNRAIDYNGGQWTYARPGQNLPIRLFITSSPLVLSELVRKEKVFVLDCREYRDWKMSWTHQAHKRAQHRPKPVSTSPAIILPGPLMGREDVDPGQQVPVVTLGLYKV